MDYLLYPYSEKVLPILENKKLLPPNIDIQIAIAPKSWLHTIKHVLPSGMSLGTDFHEGITKVDGLIVVSERFPTQYMKNDIEDKIKSAIKLSKDVICCVELSEDRVNHFRTIAQGNNCNFIYKPNERFETKQLWSIQQQDSIIVAIGNAFRGMDTTKAIVNLTKYCRDLGYRVTSISTNPSCSLLDFEILPDDLFNITSSFENTIHVINNYFNDIQLRHQPDIILLQYPDAMLKYSNYCPEDYAVKAYILSQALSVDYFILNMCIGLANSQDFEELSKAFLFRFGFLIDAVTFEHIQVNIEASKENERVKFLPVTGNEASQYIRILNEDSIGIHLLDFDKDTTYAQIVEDMINKLAGRGDECG